VVFIREVNRKIMPTLTWGLNKK